jgi:NAD(P)-dependent dehydrogenase (short-subunit alcohol dehydrogenase family)
MAVRPSERRTGMPEFGPDTTTDEVLDGVDLSGRQVVVTGAASGLGRETARAMAGHGASVVVLARSEERAAGAVAELGGLVTGGRFEPGVVDISNLTSVRAFAEHFVSEHERIDLLINNAGVMACPFGRTADGFEMQFGTNHLGHFLLTALLYPALRRSDAPRVVTLSSAGHSRSDVDLDDPNFERTEYSPWIAYGRSKTANALFARELARRADKSGLLSFSVHPGAILTDLGRHLTDELINEMVGFARQRSAAAGGASGDMHFKSTGQGAATQVWGATAAGLDAHNGAYLADCGLGVLGADPGQNGFMPYLLDDEHAAALWELSEALVQETFEP